VDSTTDEHFLAISDSVFMRVLIIKLTSMGDLVQALPALTDAQKAIPGIEFHWVVDEAFKEIPGWHSAVVRVLPTAHRRWRNQKLVLWRNRQVKEFVQQLRTEHYDIVIDAQSNLKSALVTMFSKGNKHGMDASSVREWGAHFAYRSRHNVAKNMLAIERLRRLFAEALGYQVPASSPDYGLADIQWPSAEIELPDSAFLLFVQHATWPTKRWRDQNWRQLIEQANHQGYTVLLPWGSDAERAQVEVLASGLAGTRILPRLSLSQIAGILRKSAGAICVDTGLAHISAALDVPTLTLYGPTDPSLIGATGGNAGHVVVSGYQCAPCYQRQCKVGTYTGDQAQCMKNLQAEIVWKRFEGLVGNPVGDLVN
jgi:heptosyltransferase I